MYPAIADGLSSPAHGGIPRQSYHDNGYKLQTVMRQYHAIQGNLQHIPFIDVKLSVMMDLQSLLQVAGYRWVESPVTQSIFRQSGQLMGFTSPIHGILYHFRNPNCCGSSIDKHLVYIVWPADGCIDR